MLVHANAVNGHTRDCHVRALIFVRCQSQSGWQGRKLGGDRKKEDDAVLLAAHPLIQQRNRPTQPTTSMAASDCTPDMF